MTTTSAVSAGVLLLLAVLPTSFAITDTFSCSNITSFSSESAVLRLKLAAIATILIAGSTGVCLPIAGRKLPALRPDRDALFAVKSLAAGVILGTAMVHILPEAFRSLTSPCLGRDSTLRKFPFAGFVCMMSAIGTMIVDSLATGYYRRAALSKARPVDDLDDVVDQVRAPAATRDIVEVAGDLNVNHTGHGHSHGPVVVAGEDSVGADQLLRSRVVSQVLELGIVVHSVIIGLTLGTSKNLSTVKPLVAALSFHQFFEGIGLGGCIVQAKFKFKSMVVMAMFFSLTTPIGVAVGTALSAKIEGRSSTALAVEGVFNAASAGILIYMALVDLLAADHMNPRMQSSWKLQLWAHVSLFVGVGCMSLMAKWS